MVFTPKSCRLLKNDFHFLILLKLAFLFLAMSPVEAQAYEVYPEYRTFQSEEASELQSSDKMDSEYQSDMLTFQKPFYWESYWLKQDKAFDLSFGSVSSKRFAVENRLKVHTPLHDKIDFQFIYFDQSHLEEQTSAHIIELTYWPVEKWGLALYGDGSTFKSEDDFGTAVIYRPQRNQLFRFFYTATDFSYNERSESSDSFAQSPVSFGALMRWWGEDNSEFFEMALRRDQESQWNFPDQNIQHVYSKTYFGLKGRKLMPSHHYLNYQISLLDRHEELGNEVQFLKGEYQIQHEGFVAWGGEWLFGLQYVDRIWRQSPGEVRQNNILPHLWWKIDNLALGLESTFYSAQGPLSLRSSLDTESSRTELRGNLSYTIRFKNSFMRWLFTFDLDRLGTEETWEGGCGQFITEF